VEPGLALENMKHAWVPIFVRESEDIPHGNHGLLKQGALGLKADYFDKDQSLTETLKAGIQETKVNSLIVGNSENIRDKEKDNEALSQPSIFSELDKKIVLGAFKN
jgi:hypothetical protein